MSRYRWYDAEWPGSMRVMAKRLKDKPFDTENLDGFVVDRVRDDFVEARYIERIEYAETVTDPFGRERVFDRLEYRQSEFRMSSGWPGLEVVNCPRGSSAFISSLLEVSEFSFSISPLKLDILNWLEMFQAVSNSRILVESLQLSDVEIERRVTAKIILKSAIDVRDAAKNVTQGKRHHLEKAQFRFTDGSKGNVVLTNSGTAKIENTNDTNVVLMIRESLAKLKSVTST